MKLSHFPQIHTILYISFKDKSLNWSSSCRDEERNVNYIFTFATENSGEFNVAILYTCIYIIFSCVNCHVVIWSFLITPSTLLYSHVYLKVLYKTEKKCLIFEKFLFSVNAPHFIPHDDLELRRVYLLYTAE